MGHSFTTSYLSASCPTAKRSIYLSPWVVSRHNLQPWQAGSNVLNLPLSRVHQMPYNNYWTSSKLLFWPKKNYLPPDLIVIKWVTVQHIHRTFKYKDLHNEQNPRFLIFGLWYFLANPLGHCRKFLAADLFTLVYLCPHTGVYFLN